LRTLGEIHLAEMPGVSEIIRERKHNIAVLIKFLTISFSG
jgi:hypothetical protein